MAKVVLSEEQAEAARKRSQVWRNNNRERKLQQSRDWHAANKDWKREYDKQWKKANPIKAKLLKFRTSLKKFGITYEQYCQILKFQKGRCAICKKYPDKNRRLCVDHCHDNGRVRGLLCDSCNKMLGVYEKWAQEFDDYHSRYMGGHPLVYDTPRPWYEGQTE